jgi:hypothetical protein
MSLPRVPLDSSNERQHRTVIATTVNELVKVRPPFDRTKEEVAAGVTPVDYGYAPGGPIIDARRYLGSSTNYASAIQSAITVAKNAGAASRNGATVYLDPSIDWNCGTTTLVVYDGIWLEGGANNATRITWETGVVRGIESATRTTARIFRGGLKKLTLWGPAKASGSVGMDFLRIDQFCLEDVWCINWDTGYRFDGTGDGGYRNSIIRGNCEFNNTGVLIENNANEESFHKVKITNNTDYGADIVDGDSATFFDCNFESNGVHVRTAYQWTRVMFGRMEDATSGIMWETTSTARHFHIMGVFHARGSGSQGYTDAGTFTVNLDIQKVSNFGTNLVRNGSFEAWSSGTTSAPDAWSLSNATVARESSTVWEGEFSANVTASTTAGLIFQDIPITGIYRAAQTRFLCCLFGRRNASDQWKFAAIPQDSGGTLQGTVYDDTLGSVGASGKSYVNSGWLYAHQIVEPDADATRIRIGFFPDNLDGNSTSFVDAVMCIPLDSNDHVWSENARDLAPGLERILVRTATIDFAAANPSGATVTVPGAAVGDGVLVTPPAFTGDESWRGRVSAADTVTIQKVGTADPASGDYTVVVFKR